MFHLILFQPGNSAQYRQCDPALCEYGAHLHLIRPLGFELDESRVRRAGLDYHEMTRVAVATPSGTASRKRGSIAGSQYRLEAGGAWTYPPTVLETLSSSVRETRGLPEATLAQCPEERRLYLPMFPNRSLNLSNAVAVVAFEAWRQQGSQVLCQSLSRIKASISLCLEVAAHECTDAFLRGQPRAPRDRPVRKAAFPQQYVMNEER
jgi:tRNA (cytidine/uridine-2'-O-)-methyltransferase